jgi:hypothetical protein
MVMKLRTAVGIAMIWLATVAGVSATAWVAVDRAGRDLTGAGATSLPAPPVDTAVATTTPSSGPSPTRATPQTSASTTPATATSSATFQDRSVNVAGGLVSVRCTDATILLRIAQPDDAWRVNVATSGPTQVDLRFHSGEDNAGGDTHVTAVCVSGTPAFTVANNN